MIQLRTALQRRPLVTALLLGLGLNPLVSSAVTQTASLDNGDLAGARACMRRQASVSMSSSRVSGDCSITGAVGSKDGLGRGNAVAGAPGAAALPAGCRIVSGSGSVTSAGQTLTISQSSAVLMIDCSSFRVGANASVIVEQRQGSESIVVVRISDQTPSEILGAISANGRVFLIHPNGILFGASARVRASGLVASSLNIGDADVIADKLTFGDSGNPAAVRNRGSITTPARGQVYLIAARVENTGVIGSPQGDVLLAAGRNVRLTRGGDLKAHVVVSAPTDMAWNLGSIVAQGGKIGIYGALVDQRGLVMVDSAAAGEKGDVVLKAARTTALAGGSQTTAVGADTGGTIALLGANVELVDAADVDASGRTGGGAVWIGGGFHGADAALDDATTTYVGANARVHADALQTGNGGRVAVWSNQRTAMYAKISARGGASGGNGGYVETSSRNSLGVGGSVDLTASRGTTGDLLLDPYTITIDDVGSAPISPTGTNPVSYTSSADSDVTAASINALLTSANVIVQTGASGGSITVTSNNLNWNTGNTLTLAASADVNIDGSILGQTGNLELIATGGNITQTAPVVVGSLSAKAGGDVTLTDPGNIVGTLAGSSGGTNGFRFSTNDNITVGTVTGNAATVTGISATGSGGVVLDAGGSVSTASATVSGPSLSIVSQSGVGSIFNPLATSVSSLTITNGSAFGGGDIAVSNTGGALTLPSITQTSSGSLGRIYVQSDDLLTVGAGGIVQNNGNPGAEMGLLAASGIAIDGRVLDGAYAVGLKTTNGDITLGSGGYLQAGALSVSAPNGSVALISSSDAIGVVAGKSSGDFAVNDNVGTMVVGTVTLANNGFIGQQSGIASTSGDVALQNTGSIYLANALSISTVSGNVGVNSTGGYIHQAGSGTVSATGMSAYAFGDVALMANNSVGTIAGQAGGGNFDFNDTGTLTVGSVASVGGLVASQNGIKTFNYRVGLTAAQDITVAAVIDSGTQTTTLTSNSGSISEAGAGAIQAGTLSGSSNGSTSLNGANTIGTLGSFSSAGFSLNDSVAIALGNPFTLNFPSAPTTGQTYTLVTAPSVSGTLTPTTVTGLSAGQSANFSYPPGQVILTISGPATPVRLQDFGVQ